MDASSNMPQFEKNPLPTGWAIAEVERDTGIGKDTLRVWERRYGFPQPLRDSLGERLYPLDQVHKLRLIKRLMDTGHRPGKIVAQSVEQLQDLLNGMSLVKGAEDCASSPPEPSALDANAPWLRWLAEDRSDLIKQALRQHIIKQGLGSTVEDLVAPLCVYVGEAWLRGELSVYQEHLFSATLQQVLREAIASVEASSPTLGQHPRVLLATTPGEYHSLGLLMAECYLALESCARFELGSSTPVVEILQAIEHMKIDVLALSFSAYASRNDVISSLQQLIDGVPAGVEIWAGGSATALQSRSVPEGITVISRARDVAAHVNDWRTRRSDETQPTSR
ncbi:MAG: MerR family transcriptional regulator [Betaproteobacteria bacterium]|nr:MerR family transcriptional regulator [Betaproteobacteria bacterium]NDF65176.1 MerR family transcriptional regulator [Betaproteobacteria bacterium]